MKVSFAEILLFLHYFSKHVICSEFNLTKRMGIQNPINRIPDEVKERLKLSFSSYYALLYWEYWNVGIRAYRYGLQKDYAKCGAVIIDKNYLLTAAHCVAEHQNWFMQGKATVYFGNFYPEKKLGPFNKNNFRYRLAAKVVEEIKIHELYAYDYDTYTYCLNDIAVLKIKGRNFPTKNRIRLCEPEYRQIGGSYSLVMTGSGINENQPTYGAHVRSDWRLNSFKVEQIPEPQFFGQIHYPIVVPGSYVCTIGNTSCLGDSGGPLVLTDRVTMKPICLYGIVSHGMFQNLIAYELGQYGDYRDIPYRDMCMAAEGNRYASVEYYKDWILYNTNKLTFLEYYLKLQNNILKIMYNRMYYTMYNYFPTSIFLPRPPF